MITIIDTLNKLKAERHFVDSLFDNFGEIYLQHYFSLEATLISKNNVRVVIDKKNNFLTAFERKNNDVWQCLMNAHPILHSANTNGEDIKSFLLKTTDALGASVLYFPLVYTKSHAYKIINKISGVSSWDRLPTPIIKKDFSSNIIWERVRDRYGSRADRQKRKFENNLHIGELDVSEISDTIKQIETHSWKHNYRQDMLSRENQFEYYTHILKTGLATSSIAFDSDNKPVAYRIDSIVNNILYVIKWSYDESYKKYSPGFYLLVVDLFKKHKQQNFRYIDLFGSPDMLKNLLETDRLNRVDLCYSPQPKNVNAIREERIRFDAKILNNYKEKKSLKKLFS